MMKKGLLFFFQILCALSLSLSSSAAEGRGFSAMPSAAEGSVGDAVELSVFYNGNMGGIGAFLVQVDFDPEVFEYQRASTAPALRDAYSLTLPGESRVNSVYTMKDGSPLSSSGNTFTYRFKVREGAAPGEAVFSVSVTQAVTPDALPLDPVDLTVPYVVLPPPSEEASLETLAPAVGELKPDFSPDRFDYTMTVPFAITSLSFTAQAAEGGSCKVNRKNLGAGGSDTEFLITVTAADGKTKNVYRVTVHREEKAASPKPSLTPGPTAEPTPAETQTPPERTPSPDRDRSSGKAVSSSPAPGKSQEQAAFSPVLRPTESEVPPPMPEGDAAERDGRRETVLRVGNDTAFSVVIPVLIMLLGIGISRPLSILICDRARKGKKQDREDEK